MSRKFRDKNKDLIKLKSIPVIWSLDKEQKQMSSIYQPKRKELEKLKLQKSYFIEDLMRKQEKENADNSA